MKKTAKNIYILIFVLIFICFFMFITLNDLQISLLFSSLNPNSYYTNNLYAIIFEIFGETVLYLMCSFALGIIFWYIFFNIKSGLSTFLQTVVFGLIFGINCFGLYRILLYLKIYVSFQINWYVISLFIFLALILSFLTILTLKFLNKSQINKLFKFALIVLFVALTSNLIVQILKGEIFGRLRFRAMNYISNFSYYSPWYVLNGTSLSETLAQSGLPPDAFRSFPSGHTSAVSILFCLYLLPKFIKIKSSTKMLCCYILPTIYIFLVAFSRIVAGAHFATDVVFAMAITFFLTLLSKSIFIPETQKFPVKGIYNNFK